MLLVDLPEREMSKKGPVKLIRIRHPQTNTFVNVESVHWSSQRMLFANTPVVADVTEVYEDVPTLWKLSSLRNANLPRYGRAR